MIAAVSTRPRVALGQNVHRPAADELGARQGERAAKVLPAALSLLRAQNVTTPCSSEIDSSVGDRAARHVPSQVFQYVGRSLLPWGGPSMNTFQSGRGQLIEPCLAVPSVASVWPTLLSRRNFPLRPTAEDRRRISRGIVAPTGRCPPSTVSATFGCVGWRLVDPIACRRAKDRRREPRRGCGVVAKFLVPCVQHESRRLAEIACFTEQSRLGSPSSCGNSKSYRALRLPRIKPDSLIGQREDDLEVVDLRQQLSRSSPANPLAEPRNTADSGDRCTNCRRCIREWHFGHSYRLPQRRRAAEQDLVDSTL